MRSAFIVWLTGLLCACAYAQDSPKAEVFGGYSFASANLTGSGRDNLNGWDGSLTGNFNRWLGVTAEITGLYGSQNVTSPLGAPCPPFCSPFHLNTHAYTFLFGPNIALRGERFTPFAHALFGAAHTSESVSLDGVSFPVLPPPLPSISVGLSDTSFAFALGGGVDVGLSRRFAWRIGGDFLQTRLFSGHAE